MKCKKSKKYNIIPQIDRSDCGVACLLTLIEYYNGSVNREELRQKSGTTISGTTLLGLYQAAKNFGFDANGCESSIESLINHPSPVILHIITIDKLQHYVIFYGQITIDGDIKLIIGDPAKGIIYLTKTELENIWKSRTCLTLVPNSNFVTLKEKSRNKRVWIKNYITPDASTLSIAVFLGLIIACLGLVMAIFSQRLIDQIIPHHDFSKLYIGITLVFILLFAKEGINYLRQLLLLRQSKSFNTRISISFFNHLLMLSKSFFDTRKIGELTARLNDTSRIQKVISQIVNNIVIDGLIAIVIFIFLFLYSPLIGTLSLIIIPLYFYLIYKNNKQIIEGQRKIMSNYAISESNYISTLQGIEPIKNFSKIELFSKRNKFAYDNFQESILSFGKIQIKLSFTANGIGIVFLIAVLLQNSLSVMHNNLKIGELIAITSMCASLLPSIANIALISIPINEASIAFDRMFEFTNIEKENINNGVEVSNFSSLIFQNLSFRFVGRKELLKNINLSVIKGEIIALLGENGSGKSTISQIIQKHYQYDNGSIIINNDKELKKISTFNWHKIVSVVPQKIHIFNASVLENIAFEDAYLKPKEVIFFLEEYGFLALLNNLPQSYMTLIGEEGINISGGQIQIISLARALYHKPQLLILDEATAAMDRQTELLILSLLQKLKEKMAIIFITHKLNVLKSFCDKIFILESGVISNHGNHNYLLQSDNLYSQYWNDLN